MTVDKAPRSKKLAGLWLWLMPLVLLGAGFAAARWWVLAPNDVVAQEEVAPPPPQQVAVTALGRLEPEGEVVTVGGPAGDRIGRLDVQEGDFVQQGAILAYLESYDERTAERDYAASQLNEAKTRLEAETRFGQAQVEEAKTRLQQVDSPRSLEIEAQRATIRQLEAELALAQTELNRFQALQSEGALSQQSLDRQVSASRQVQERLTNARITLNRLEASRSTDLNNARAQVTSQESELRRSQSQIQVDSAARNLRLAEARLARTVIRAPRDGEVLRILTYPGEAIAESGILELGNTRQMYVVAEVYESDVRRVKVGQPATILSRNGAFNETLNGTVAQIGGQIFKNNVLDDDPAANADARVVEVKIRLADSTPVAKLTNLQVDVRIEVE